MVGLGWSAPVEAQDVRDRVALVIGNAAYEHLPSLDNPYNDAKGLAAALWQAGFETIELLDGSREEMVAAIATFASRLHSGTDAVFFYAGHGVQSGGGNYLLPVSTKLDDA
ncbi:MAG: caspase family protein, partial [Pseudomonadota bacterium]